MGNEAVKTVQADDSVGSIAGCEGDISEFEMANGQVQYHYAWLHTSKGSRADKFLSIALTDK